MCIRDSPEQGTAFRQRTVSLLLRPSYTHAHITQSFTDFRAKERLLGIWGGTAEIQAKALRHRLRAVSLFSWSIEQNVRDTQMTTGLLRARDGRGTKKECSSGTKAFLGNEERLWALLLIALYLMFLFSGNVTKILRCFSCHQLVNGFDYWRFVVNASRISQSYFALWGQRIFHLL